MYTQSRITAVAYDTAEETPEDIRCLIILENLDTGKKAAGYSLRLGVVFAINGELPEGRWTARALVQRDLGGGYEQLGTVYSDEIWTLEGIGEHQFTIEFSSDDFLND